jgi:hypothetical protein
MVRRNADSIGKERVKTKRQNTSAQPEYIPPPYVVKCPFDKDQKPFWLETSEWFRAHHRFVEGAKYDDDLNKPQPLHEAFKKIVPEKFRRAVRDVGQSAYQAFQIVQNKDLGANTKSFPKGASDEGIYNHWEQRKKGLALFLLKHGSALWNPHVYPGIEQAIKENDIEFFRVAIPETLNGRRKVVCFDPDEPSGETLEHWLVSFWCPGNYWPSWADSNFPPFCLFTHTALTNFLSCVRITDVQYDRVNDAINELGLVSFKGPGRIKSAVKQSDGSIILKPL